MPLLALNIAKNCITIRSTLKRLDMSKKLVTILCDHIAPDCPEIHTDDSLSEDKQVLITDDFGNRINMSKAQFRILLDQAKTGKITI